MHFLAGLAEMQVSRERNKEAQTGYLHSPIMPGLAGVAISALNGLQYLQICTGMCGSQRPLIRGE